MKELKFEELTIEQKLGLMCVAFCSEKYPEDVDFVEAQIRKRAVGGIWVVSRGEESLKILKRLKDAADYPLLVFTDAEGGFGEYMIGKHNTLSCVDSVDSAYMFGKVTALAAREQGYNIISGPVLDLTDRNTVCGITCRSLGYDKYRVTELAGAIARGMQDGGVLTMAKHYPGTSETAYDIDAHMAETASSMTRQELLEYNLYPYIELNRQGLLDGIMPGHSRFSMIDPDYPASLSGKLMQVFRDEGFEGIAVTDALDMMGVISKFGKFGSIATAIGNAGSVALPFFADNRSIAEQLMQSYEDGKIPDDMLDEGVKRMLVAQHKVVTRQPKFDSITEEDKAAIKQINYDSVIARADVGLTHTVSRDGRHCFVILTATDLDLRDANGVEEDTMKTEWYNPYRIKERIEELFPNSFVTSVNEYPTPKQNRKVLRDIMGFETGEPYDDVVFITFYQSQTYVGRECFTARIISLFEALDVTKSTAAIVHFGNPFVIEDLPHIPRIIIGVSSSQGVEAGLDVLAGEYNANGKLIYNVKFT